MGNVQSFLLIIIMLAQGRSTYCQGTTTLHTPLGTLARSNEPDNPGISTTLPPFEEGSAMLVIENNAPQVEDTWAGKSPQALRLMAEELRAEGDSASAQSKFTKAIAAYERAIALFHTLRDTVAVAAGYALIANQYDQLGDYPAAIQGYRSALAYQILLNNVPNQAIAWFKLGEMHRQATYLREAEWCYDQAIGLSANKACKPMKRLSYLNSLADLYIHQARYTEADSVLEMAVAIQVALPDSQHKSLTFELAANSQFFQGNMVRAFELYTEALQLSEQLDQPRHVGANLHNIGRVMQSVENYDEAISYFNEALKLRKDIAHKAGIVATKSALGALYIDLDKCEKAKVYFMEAMDVATALKDKQQLTFIYQNLGVICVQFDDQDQAEKYLNQAIKLGTETDQQLRIHESKYLLGIIYAEQGRQAEAEALWLSIQKWGVANKQYLLASNVCGQLSDLYADKKRYQLAYRYRTLEGEYNDSLQTFQAQRNIVKQNFEFRLNQLQEVEQMRQQKQSQMYKGQIKRQRNHKYFFIVAFALALLVAFFVYRNFRIKNQVNEMLEEKNRLISAQKEQIMNLNQSLERKVAKRTEELEKRNVQLREYAFMNSHRVRGPLANILGVFRLREEDGFDNPEEEREFFDMAAQSAKEMDNIIQLMNDKLNEEQNPEHP